MRSIVRDLVRRPRFPLRQLTALALFGLAIVRAFFSTIAESMDETFFILIGLGFALLLLPIEKLTALKAGGFELSLEKPQVQGAIRSLGLERVEDKRLKGKISKYNELLPAIMGSRVLWIDDRPHKIVAERRLLRALGVDVTAATSSEMARGILDADNDFDLIITDVQRKGSTHELTGGVPIHEGTNFVVWLRKEYPDRVVSSLPVVFYAAYDWERLVRFTRPARETAPEPAIANTIADLVEKVIDRLAEARSAPIATREKKTPTSARNVERQEKPSGGVGNERSQGG